MTKAALKIWTGVLLVIAALATHHHTIALVVWTMTVVYTIGYGFFAWYDRP